MGLANVRFEVKIEPVDPGESGADAVCFLIFGQPGQPMAPLVEVASGGEMSRFLLALKRRWRRSMDPAPFFSMRSTLV